MLGKCRKSGLPFVSGMQKMNGGSDKGILDVDDYLSG